MTATFHLDLCAILLMTALIIGIIVRKLYRGRTNMAFLLLVVSGFLTSVFDFIAELAANDIIFSSENLVFRYIIDYLFFICRNITAPIYILYIASLMGVWYLTKKKRYLIYIWSVPYIIDLVLILGNPIFKWMFYYDSNNVYHRGPLYAILYAVAAFYMIISVDVIFRFKELTSLEKKFMLMMFLPFNLASVLLLAVIPNWRFDIITTAILITYTAVSLQRPEEYYEDTTNSQSSSSFRNEIKMAVAASTPICIVLYKFTNYATLRTSIGVDKFSDLLTYVATKFAHLNDTTRTRASVFYMDNGTFAALSSQSYCDRMAKMGEEFLKIAEVPVKVGKMNVKLESKACVFRFPEELDSVDSLFSFVDNFDRRISETGKLVDVKELAGTKDFKMKNDINMIINKGIINKNFQMYYQPIYSIKEKKFTSAEALIRLIDEDYGFVSPGLFIPESEKTGAIHQIGDYVFDAVCGFMSGDVYKSLGMEYIEINLSVAQCIEYDLVEKIKKVIDKHKIKPNQINLEITETAVDYDPTITDTNVSSLSELGFTFSLDDYGTGYSNIRRVVSLPIDIVKIDKSLVDEMDNPLMWKVITNTVTMLKNMNKKILVEGVEDKRTLDRFTELGCDYIQGFYFSKPLPEKEFSEFIKRENSIN